MLGMVGWGVVRLCGVLRGGVELGVVGLCWIWCVWGVVWLGWVGSRCVL